MMPELGAAAGDDGFRGERPQSDARPTSGDSCGEVPLGLGVTVKDFPASPAQSLGGREEPDNRGAEARRL